MNNLVLTFKNSYFSRLNYPAQRDTTKSFMSLWRYKLGLYLTFPQAYCDPIFHQKPSKDQDLPLDEDSTRAATYLSTIEDPLWKIICQDMLNMMGPASLLKIAGSLLGETCSQSKDIMIYCKTDETAQFIQQYDFVILGSLRSYLPSLKQLNVVVDQL